MPLCRFAVIGAALIGEDSVREVTIVRATMLRPLISRPFDIRLRPWAFRPGIGLLPMDFCCATSPVVAGAIRTRKWLLSRVFVGFDRQYVRSGHYGEVCDFFPGDVSYPKMQQTHRDRFIPQEGMAGLARWRCSSMVATALRTSQRHNHAMHIITAPGGG